MSQQSAGHAALQVEGRLLNGMCTVHIALRGGQNEDLKIVFYHPNGCLHTSTIVE